MRLFWASLFTGVFFIILTALYYLLTGDLEGSLASFIAILVIELFTGGVVLYFAYVTGRSDPGLNELNYASLRNIIIKNDVWFFKRLLMFDDSGKYVGRATINIKSLWDFIVSLLSHLSIIVPLDYHLRDHEGNFISIFRRRGFRSAIVDIYNGDREPVGRVEFDELKVIIKFNGTVYVDEKPFPVTTEFFFEDADAEGVLMLSSFSNAVAYHDIFRSMNNEVGTLKEPLNTDTGKVALTLMAILYYVRWNSN